MKQVRSVTTISGSHAATVGNVQRMIASGVKVRGALPVMEVNASPRSASPPLPRR